MTAKSEVYKCEVCGAIVAVVTGGKGELACCEKKMAEQSGFIIRCSW